MRGIKVNTSMIVQGYYQHYFQALCILSINLNSFRNLTSSTCGFRIIDKKHEFTANSKQYKQVYDLFNHWNDTSHPNFEVPDQEKNTNKNLY